MHSLLCLILYAAWLSLLCNLDFSCFKSLYYVPFALVVLVCCSLPPLENTHERTHASSPARTHAGTHTRVRARAHTRVYKHTYSRRRSGCRCSMGRWRPTVTPLTPLFDGSLAINGRSLVHSNKYSRGRAGFRDFVCVFRV